MRQAAKLLRFPLGGLAADGPYRDTTYPTEESVYATPMAVNVIGPCALSGRERGGSRPGLRRVTGVAASGRARWLWPNGQGIAAGSAALVFADVESATLADGTRLALQHPARTVYRDRLVKADGAAWLASRTGDFGDFDFGGEGEDPTRPCAGTLAPAGAKGEAITALCPFGDARLFAATRRRLAVCAGEPSGAWTTLSENVGIVSADAWCDADGALYFVGPNGLYAVGDGAPILVSQRIPRELRGLSSALLVHDPSYGGIHVFTDEGDWFYDIARKAFWPMSYPAAKRPTAGFNALVGGEARLVFRCADGEYRRWDDSADADDGTALESRVAIGPFLCGANGGDGMLDALDATLAEGSADVSAAVATAHTAERAADADAAELAATLHKGFNPTVRARRRGAWATLVLSSRGRWAYESIIARTKAFGRLRP